MKIGTFYECIDCARNESEADHMRALDMNRDVDAALHSGFGTDVEAYLRARFAVMRRDNPDATIITNCLHYAKCPVHSDGFWIRRSRRAQLAPRGRLL